MEIKEVVIDQKLQSNLNSLIENTLEEEKKWKKTSVSSLIIMLLNQKKKIRDVKNKTVQHDTNRIMKLFDRSFVFDIYVLTAKNINPFSLERKIFDIKNREMINMFWEDCNEPSFYKHICQSENFLHLNRKNVIYPRVSEIVMNYIEADKL